MDLLIELERVETLHPDVQCILSSTELFFQERRCELQAIWKRFYEGGLSEHNFVTDFSLQPTQRYFELVLGHLLLEEGLSVSRPDKGADFRIAKTGVSIWIEAIAPTRGTSQDQVPENSVWEPIDQIRLRLTSAISTKRANRTKYGIPVDSPFVIAINTAEIGYGCDVEHLLQALFGIGGLVLRFKRPEDPDQEVQFLGYYRRFEEMIRKQNHEPIYMNGFITDTLKDVSGILIGRFNINWPLSEIRRRSVLSLVRNPFASHPLPRGVLTFAKDVDDYQLF